MVKLLGKSIGFNTIKDKLARIWKPTTGLDILDIDNHFCMVKFDIESNRTKVMKDDP